MTLSTAKPDAGPHLSEPATWEGMNSSSRDHAHTATAARIASDDAGQQLGGAEL